MLRTCMAAICRGSWLMSVPRPPGFHGVVKEGFGSAKACCIPADLRSQFRHSLEPTRAFGW